MSLYIKLFNNSSLSYQDIFMKFVINSVQMIWRHKINWIVQSLNQIAKVWYQLQYFDV